MKNIIKCNIFKAVIFDLDGTLADTLADIADSMNNVLLRNGFPTHYQDSYRTFVGNGLYNLVVRTLPDNVKEEVDIVTSCYHQMLVEYDQNCMNKTCLYDGIAQLLDDLSHQKIKLVVLSNKADKLTQKICSKLLNNWTFDMILGESGRFPKKPDPASSLFICDTLAVSPCQVCYVGDSDVDMQTAAAAGFYAVGAGWGFRTAEELFENKANEVIEHPTDLCRILFTN
jgi:phosphoglycolate phosphatase